MKSETTYLTVVDRDGNMASWIQGIADNFGSGITVAGMGFMLHNRGAGFTLEANHPDRLAGGKRPFTRSFRAAWNAATSILHSALWAARTSRWHTHSLSRTSSISG